MGILFAFAGVVVLLYVLEAHWRPHAATHEGESGLGGVGDFEPVSAKEFFGRLAPLFLGAAACPLLFKSFLAGAAMAVAAGLLAFTCGRGEA
jgi:hypothetical protein